jgi:Mg2+-importing ATPase
MARSRVIVKHLAAIQNFGSIDVLCSDKTGTLTRGEMQLADATDARDAKDPRVLTLASVAARLQSGIRNPLDDAIISAGPETPGWEKLDEIPFDFERRRMGVVVRHNGQRLLVVKGAPESILSACIAVQAGSQTQPLDAALREAALGVVRGHGAGGLRTIAVATRELAPNEPAGASAIRDLVLAGWLTFADPPLSDADEMIAALARDGVQLKILTGDDEAVARHVCTATGIDVSRAVTGAEMDSISDTALGAVAERTTLFARVSPQQKLRIITALKGRGHVVGYMGDGINDAPSLHMADVGISVAGAVDVAKDAADIILLDRGLEVLHTGIVEGRKAFGNVMKYLLMGTSSNFGNMFSMAAASVFVPFLPMLPTQILLNNFLYDFAQVAIPSDRVDDVYIRKPHHWDMRVLRQFMIRIGLVSSAFDIMTFAVLLFAFRATPEQFRTGWFIESLATQTLVLLIIRTTGNPFRNRPSRLLAATVAATTLMGVALPFTPFRRPLGFVVPSPVFLLFVAAATIAYLAAVEIAKRRLVPRLLA